MPILLLVNALPMVKSMDQFTEAAAEGVLQNLGT